VRGKAPPPPAYTLREVARARRVATRTARGWVRAGLLVAINVGTTDRPRLVVTAESLAAFDEARAVPSARKAAPRRRRKSAGVIDFYPD
jgi:hypothetical protein